MSATSLSSAIFRVEQLAKVFGEGPTAVHALRGVTLEVEEGRLSVLLGPSSSGKSAFLSILGGLDRADSGHAWFRDTELTVCDDDALTDYDGAASASCFNSTI